MIEAHKKLPFLCETNTKWTYQKVVHVIVVGSAFSFPLAVVSVADLSVQKIPLS